LNRSQNPGGHKEGRASFPIKSQYKNLINPYLYFLERRGREKRKRDRKRGGARRRWWPGAGLSGARREERGEGVFKVPTQESKIPFDLN